mmetsp:Transcript_23272/g.40173  ORF Transcript_23272/g.40173 Transcript_23272/m.40173 type:complete len:588 (-) Transcript_23272:1110-2873(-)
MSILAAEKCRIEASDFRIDPGVGPIGTTVHDPFEIRVGPDLPRGFAHRAGQAARHVKPIKRQDTPPARINPKHVRIIPAFGHWENATGISLQQKFRRDHKVFHRRLAWRVKTRAVWRHLRLPPSVALRNHRLAGILLQPVFQPMDVVIAGMDVFFSKKRMEQWHGCVDPVDDQFAKGPVQARKCLGTVTAMNDQLADQTVVIGRNDIAVIKCRIHTNAQSTGGVILCDPTGGGREMRQFFRIQTHFDGMAVDRQIVLLERQVFARCDKDLFAHQINAKDGFGDGMFDLQARVHLDEVKLTVFVEELDGARTGIVDIGHGISTDFADGGAFFGADCGAGGLFEHLLVAALQGTVPFAQVHSAALAVPKDLDLDVAGRGQIFLDIDFVIAKGGFAFGPRSHERVFHIGCGLRHFHATATAARSRLDDDGIAHLVAKRLGLVERGNATIRSGYAGHAERLHRVFGGDLVAHDADMFGGRPDKGQPVIFDDLHKLRVLGQEAIAGVNGLRPGDFAGGDDGRKAQIGLRGGRRADADTFVGHAHMHGVGVRSGMHRHRGDAHFARGPDDPQRNLAPVGDQDFFEHARPLTQG